MMRIVVLGVAIVLLNGCAARIPVPDLCDMPPGFRSWNGARVSWSGLVMGGYHHGFALICERHRGGVGLDWDETTVGSSQFEQAIRRTLDSPSLLKVRVEGRLMRNDDQVTIRATAITDIRVTPMSENDWYDFWDAHDRRSRS
jgi:hypothetical protein